MKEWIGAVAYALLSLVLGVLLRELGFKGSRLVFLIGTVGIVGAAALYAGRLFNSLSVIGMDNSEYARAMLKIVGVGYVFGICSDICSELGENVLSTAVTLFGRVEIITLSLPFVKMIVEKGLEII
jgi:stage III sporulation protein AD